MVKVLLVHPPFCTPLSPSYALSNMYSALKENCEGLAVEVLDLNQEFHIKRYPDFFKYSRNFLDDYDAKTYELNAKKFMSESKNDYSQSNKSVVKGETPLLFDDMIKLIMSHSPDTVAFSVIYSSQVFYTYALIKELKKRGIQTVVGGPAVNENLANTADKLLYDEKGLIEFFSKKPILNIKKRYIPNFDVWNQKKYFIPTKVIPLKTSNTCYYKQCAYCSHYSSAKHEEYELEYLQSIIKNVGRGSIVFLIDDMIRKERLLELSGIFKKYEIIWTCQLRPTAEFDKKTFNTLSKNGLKMIMWGIESGSDRVLKLINKGTNTSDISNVLKNSHEAGIRNVGYILFGFPTETEEEFMETIDFLKKNQEHLSLVSTSLFGLQKYTKIYDNPEKYGITKIIEKKRTILDEKIDYETESGLSQEETKMLKKKHNKFFEQINKYPHNMNYFREHMICLIKSELKK